METEESCLNRPPSGPQSPLARRLRVASSRGVGLVYCLLFLVYCRRCAAWNQKPSVSSAVVVPDNSFEEFEEAALERVDRLVVLEGETRKGRGRQAAGATLIQTCTCA